MSITTPHIKAQPTVCNLKGWNRNLNNRTLFAAREFQLSSFSKLYNYIIPSLDHRKFKTLIGKEQNCNSKCFGVLHHINCKFVTPIRDDNKWNPKSTNQGAECVFRVVDGRVMPMFREVSPAFQNNVPALD